jgi:outer membrane protein assembly factor BamE
VQPVNKAKDKGLMDKLKFWKKDDVPPAVLPPPDKAKQVPPSTEATPAQSPEQVTTPTAEPAPAQPEATPSPTEEAAPAEEPKSLLSVPMEVPATTSQPIAPEPAPAEPVPTEPAASPAPAETTSQPQPASESPPAVEAPYEPSSGMQFDRNLKTNSEPVPADAPSVKPADAQPAATPARAGNKTPPAPKELPPESDPDFFEKMLEKIGF